MRGLAVVFALVSLGAPLSAQSLLYRPPNMGGTWVPDAAVVQFNFLHRFYVASSAGSHKVTNFPTFTLEAGLGKGVGFGLHYASNSFLISSPYVPNETEVFGRWRAWGGPEGTPGFAVAFTPAYNFAAQSVDGEVEVDWTYKRLTALGAVRISQHALARDAKARQAFAGGLVLRATRYIALSGDVGAFTNPKVTAAWSAALNFQIPGAPHTFSLQASTAGTNTIQGSSIANPLNKVLYGFEFTIPLHLKRFGPWFGKEASHAEAGESGPVAVSIDVRSMGFRTDSVMIQAGQAVRWTNQDPLVHTVNFDDPNTTSSGEIPSNGSWVKRFDKPGVYTYHCLPHPFMKGVVVVK